MTRVLFADNMEIEVIIRIVYACLLGLVIGLERSKKHKSAGLRTYILVAIGATIFTIVSKYGFLTIAAEKTRVDVSRVAHTIVTGVGFLGAGIISAKGDKVQGITTAAGIWATAAIGIACGSGMYIAAGVTAGLILIIQALLREWAPVGHEKLGKIVVCLNDREDSLQEFKQFLNRMDIVIYGTKIKLQDDNTMMYTFTVRMPLLVDVVGMSTLIAGRQEVKSFDIV